jgi:hypothetical protein
MSLQEHNLNIHMYSLEELLGLFNLTYDITLNDLKRAKKIVLMTHPDKSKLDSKYFLFYKQAFDVVVRFYDNQNKQSREATPQNTVYHTNNLFNTNDSQTNKKISSVINDMSKREFNNKFNDLFEQNMMKKVDDSKNEWFRNQDSIYSSDVQVNASNMGQVFNNIKDKQFGLIKYKGVENIISNKSSNSSYHDDDDDDDDSYVTSDPFSKLKFDDLRKVHKDETVFSVSERDYDKVTKYASVDHFMRARSNQSTTPLSKPEAEQLLAQQEQLYREKMMKKEYSSNLQSMRYEEKNKSVLSNFLRLQF